MARSPVPPARVARLQFGLWALFAATALAAVVALFARQEDDLEESLREYLELNASASVEVVHVRESDSSQRAIVLVDRPSGYRLVAAYRRKLGERRTEIFSHWAVPEVEILQIDGADSWEDFYRDYTSRPTDHEIQEFIEWVETWEPVRQ